MTCQQPGTSSPPSAVTLATILTDLGWRRHVALDWDNQPFYQRIAESIGEQSYPSWPFSSDPVRRWVRFHAPGSSSYAPGPGASRPFHPSASNDRPMTTSPDPAGREINAAI